MSFSPPNPGSIDKKSDLQKWKKNSLNTLKHAVLWMFVASFVEVLHRSSN